MISQNQIARLLEAQEYSILVDRVLSNGRCRSESARRLLRDPSCAASAALGMALQRAAELTYRPTPMADGLVHRLLARQMPDGSFLESTTAGMDGRLAATAVALRGLLTWQTQCEWSRQTRESAVQEAIESGLNWIAGQFRGAESIQGNELGWAIVLWQLGDVEALRVRMPLHNLLHLLQETESELVEDELCRYAAAMAA